MIGPVSTTGRAMMASLQQAIDKGMPPDQAIQYVKSMAQQGVAPLTDLYSMMSQFERLKQKQVKPPQTPPTIKDQLNIMDQMQSQQPPAQPGNIQQMQATPPAPSPMDRGLGAIDAGRMEYPQFNGGGIVAFQEGGPTGQFYGGFYPGMFDGPDRQQRMFGYSEPSPVQDYVSMGRELRKDPYLLKDLKEDPDSVPMTLPTITNPNSGLRAPEGGAYGGGGGGELPYGGPTSYGQNSLQNYLDQFYMDQMMQGGKQYAGGIYDMEGNKIGKAAGGVIGFQEGSRKPVSSGPQVPYVFNDELAARIPSFMKSDMDIVSFVKAQMPNFDALPMAQKQEVLKQFEPVYMRARAARNTLIGRNAPEVAAPPAPAPVDMMATTPVLSATSPFMTEDEAVQQLLAAQSTRPSEAPQPATEREVTVTGRRAAKSEPKEDRFEDYRYEKPDLAAIRAEREERQKKEKTGAFSQADADLAAYVKEQKEQYGASEKEARNNFWIQTGAALMANKSPYFLQALGESIQSNYGGLVRDLKKLKDDNSALRLQEIQLRQAQERAMETGSKEDQQRYDTLSQRFDARQYDIFKTKLEIEQKALNRDHERSLVMLRQYGNDKAITQLNKMYADAMAIEDEAQREDALTRYRAYREEVRQNTIASTAGGVAAEIRADVAGQTRLANLAKNDPIYRNAQRIVESSQDPEEVRRAQEIIRIKEQQAQGTMPAGPRVAPTQSQVGRGYTGLPTTSGW